MGIYRAFALCRQNNKAWAMELMLKLFFKKKSRVRVKEEITEQTGAETSVFESPFYHPGRCNRAESSLEPLQGFIALSQN